MVVYLQWTTNNKAESVLAYVWKATRSYGIPSRVRFDKGGENIMVCGITEGSGERTSYCWPFYP